MLVVPEVSCAAWNWTRNKLCQCLVSVDTDFSTIPSVSEYVLLSDRYEGWSVLVTLNGTSCGLCLLIIIFAFGSDRSSVNSTVHLGAVVTSRTGSVGCFFWSLIKWLKLADSCDSKKILAYSVCYFFKQAPSVALT